VSVLVLYGLPAAAYLAISMPFSIWLMKHATDVLLVAPAAMGTILLLGRLWDAISDPMAGYLSDRTRSRFGRRRIWLLGSAVPLAITYVMLWAPPESLEGIVLLGWLLVALLLFETASTAFSVPHAALGLELTSDYHERTRVFAWRHVLTTVGYGASLGLVYVLRSAGEPRVAAFWVALAAGLATAVLVGLCALGLPERGEGMGRGGVSLLRSFRDVFANPHALRLFVVYGVETFGVGVIATLAAYIMEEVVRRADLLEWLLASWMIPQILLAPMWIRLSRRFGKKRLWLFGMCCNLLGFSGMLFLDEGRLLLVFVMVLLIGVGGGVGNVISPSVQADVVDFDELSSGERKEGAYTAVWNFIRKAGMALAAGAGGVALSVSGYDASVEVQSDTVRDTIRIFCSVVPLCFYAIGLAVFSRFGLDEEEHARVMQRIRDRAANQRG
jgi:GPH family glycoside/pentoside/hexuronide:cation symporter